MDAWIPEDASKVIPGRVVSDGHVANFNYPCDSCWDCTPYKTNLPTGLYKVEVWGARGGTGRQSGTITHSTPGGYSVGVLRLTKTSLVYVYIGGHGEDGINPATSDMKGGFNGGGDSPQDIYHGTDDQAGGGGGASDIRVDDKDLDHRVIVAGGGGGAAYYRYSISEVGYGGGLIAGPPKSDYGADRSADQSYGYLKGIGENGKICSNRESPAAGGGGGYWGGKIPTPEGCDGHAGGGSGYIGGVTSFQDITPQSIPGNTEIFLLNGTKSIGNPGHGAARITMIGYILTKVSEIEQIYSPGSNFSITFEVNTLMNTDEQSTIYRKINNSEEIQVDRHADTKQVYRFTDTFPLPKKSDYYQITYAVTSKAGSRTEVSYKILVNAIPKITAVTNLSTRYKPNALAHLDVLLEDDTYVELTIQNSNHKNIATELYDCYYKENNIVRFEFTIPDAPIDSMHTVSLFAFDEFDTISNTLNFTYTIVDVYLPEIRLTKKPSYAYAMHQMITIEGEYRDPDAHDKIWIKSRNDGKNLTEHRYFENYDDDWHPFSFKYDTKRVSTDVHELQIFSFTSLESIPILVKYALIDRSHDIFHNFATSGCLPSFMRFAILICNIIIDMYNAS